MVTKELLNERAYSLMIDFFNEKNHRPSEAMLRGLRRIQGMLTDMLTGVAQDCYHLASLDCGVGKSTAIIKWLQVYLECPGRYEDKGVIVGLDRYNDIERFIDDSDLPPDSYAALVSEKCPSDLNTRGVGAYNLQSATVLFTTKEQIKRRCHGRLFKDAEALCYKGQPRVVRVWDESLMVGKGLKLDMMDLGIVLSMLNKKEPKAAMQILSTMNDLEKCGNGEVYQMPSLGLSVNELLSSCRDMQWDQRSIIETFGLMLDKAVTVRKDLKGHVLVDCVEELPNDFTPCLITDASGRIRETYKLQERYRGDVKRLIPDECNKRYDPLTVNIWYRGSGKTYYRDNGTAETAEEILRVLNSKPSQEFLIILFEEISQLKTAILKRLTPDSRDRVKFLTWGQHTATNGYSEIPNIIVASTLFYRVADYEAIARASATKPTSDGAMSNGEIDRVRKGELAHHLLQAICRGKVRKSEGDKCPKSEVWLIASPNTGIKDLLRKIFPYCTVSTWETKPVPLTGMRERVFKYVLESVRNGAREIPATKVRDHFGLDKSNFKRDILRNEELQRKLERESITIELKGTRFHFVKIDFQHYFPNAA